MFSRRWRILLTVAGVMATVTGIAAAASTASAAEPRRVEFYADNPSAGYIGSICVTAQVTTPTGGTQDLGRKCDEGLFLHEETTLAWDIDPTFDNSPVYMVWEAWVDDAHPNKSYGSYIVPEHSNSNYCFSFQGSVGLPDYKVRNCNGAAPVLNESGQS
jgi:hypothetical protein